MSDETRENLLTRIEELEDHAERVERLLILARPLLVTHRSWKSAPLVEKIDKALVVNWEKSATPSAPHALGRT